MLGYLTTKDVNHMLGSLTTNNVNQVLWSVILASFANLKGLLGVRQKSTVTEPKKEFSFEYLTCQVVKHIPSSHSLTPFILIYLREFLYR